MVDGSASQSPTRKTTKPTNPGYVNGVFAHDRDVASPSKSARGDSPKRRGGAGEWWERDGGGLSWWESGERARQYFLKGRLQA